MIDKKEIGRRLREAREIAGLSRPDVGSYWQLAPRESHTTLGRYETGEVLPEPDRLAFLVSLYGTTKDWILEGEGAAPVKRDSTRLPVKAVPGTLQQLVKGYELLRDGTKPDGTHATKEELAEALAVIEAHARSQQEIHASTPEALDLIVNALINQLTGRHRVTKEHASEGSDTVGDAPQRKRGNGHQ